MELSNTITENMGGYYKITPCENYKIRRIGDNYQSYREVDIPIGREDDIGKYHAVPIDEPDEVVEETDIQPTDDEEISAEEALAIIVGGGDDDQS